MMYKEVTANPRNLVTAWLDYQTDFDSVPHIWIIESLELVRMPLTMQQNNSCINGKPKHISERQQLV